MADSESGPDTGANELMGIRKGIRIGNARDGKKFAFIEDIESTMPDHSAEGLGVDVQGNVYGAVVRRSDVRAVASVALKLKLGSSWPGCAVVAFLRAMFGVSKRRSQAISCDPATRMAMCTRGSKRVGERVITNGREEASRWSRVCGVSSIRHWADKFC